MALGNLGEYDVLNYIFGNVSIPQRATLYVALGSGSPEEDGSDKHELSGGGYERVKITGVTKFSAASAGTIVTASTITFPTATAAWETATHFFIATGSTVCDTTDSILAHGELEHSKIVQTDDIASFQAGELTISIS